NGALTNDHLARTGLWRWGVFKNQLVRATVFVYPIYFQSSLLWFVYPVKRGGQPGPLFHSALQTIGEQLKNSVPALAFAAFAGQAAIAFMACSERLPGLLRALPGVNGSTVFFCHAFPCLAVGKIKFHAIGKAVITIDDA